MNSADELRLPHLGDYLRGLRDGAGLTRQDLSVRARVSVTHIRDIEAGKQRPTDQTLRALANGVGASPELRHQLLALRDPLDLPSCEHIAAQLTSGHRRWLAHDDTNGLLMAYFDRLGALLAASDRYIQAFPGIDESGHLLAWIYGPSAKGVLVDWDATASAATAVFRTVLGQHRCATRAARLLNELAEHDDFRRHWRRAQSVFPDWGDQACVHLRLDGTPTTVNLLVGSVGAHAVVHFGRVGPYCGPRPWDWHAEKARYVDALPSTAGLGSAVARQAHAHS